ncbi:MAG: hypothetical protein ACJAZ3_001211 [Sphingobacteriales bacterium]|jgi:hypothetical protein
MKRKLTLFALIIGLSATLVIGQNATINTKNTQQFQGVEINKDELKKSSKSSEAPGNRAYNYGRANQDVGIVGSNIVDVPVFYDTIGRDFGGSRGTVFIHYVANLLDPTSQIFSLQADQNLGNTGQNDLYITDKNAYMVDSVFMNTQYLRNQETEAVYSQDTLETAVDTADYDTIAGTTHDSAYVRYITNADTINLLIGKKAIVDTFYTEVFYETTNSKFQTGNVTGVTASGTVSERYGEDTVFFKNIPFDKVNRTVNWPNVVSQEVTLDSVFAADSLLPALFTGGGAESGPYFEFGMEANVEVDAGLLVAFGFGFKPGFAYNQSVAFDTARTLVKTETARDTIRNLADDADSVYVLDTTVVTTYEVTAVVTLNVPDEIESHNSIQFNSFEENGQGSDPLYYKGEWNNSYYAPNTSLYTNDINPRLSSRYETTNTQQIENHDVFFLISCNSCFSTSIDGKVAESTFETSVLYPNPVVKGNEAKVNIKAIDNGSPMLVTVTNSLGAVVRSFETPKVLGDMTLSIKTDLLETGVYMINMNSGGISQSQKLIVTN